MPFGISPAPEYFQQRLDQNLEGLPDDLLIAGKGSNIDEATKDHNRNLRKFLEKCKD